MARWFRRKDKDQGPDQGQEASQPDEGLPPSEAAAEPAATHAVGEAAAPPAESLDAAPPEAAAEPAKPRRGFFGLFRRERREVTPEAAEIAEVPEVADAAEAAATLEVEPPAAIPPPVEPALAPPPPEAEAAPPVLAEAPLEEAAAIVEAMAPPPEAAPREAAEAVEAAEPEELAEPEEPEELAAPEAQRKGLFRRLRERLTRTRDALAGGLDRLFAGKKVIDAALLDDLEELLITADLGVDTSLRLIKGLRDRLKRKELGDLERLRAALHDEMLALLAAPPPPERDSRPWVIMLVGVNGVGKTTSIAKLAHQDRRQGRQPLLVAADTFRAAAVEQLEIWGERVGAQVIKQKHGADPAAVVFDGLAAALARGADTVYIDTAGRLHTKVNLMEELKKVHRTAGKKLPGAPHEVLLILDATTGQNALSQARLFHEAVGISGIILTKMDGTAKGGVALAVAHETGIPIRYLGVGESMDDLRPFDPEAYVAAILG
jgi:fused signal recognition particle receptor